MPSGVMACCTGKRLERSAPKRSENNDSRCRGVVDQGNGSTHIGNNVMTPNELIELVTSIGVLVGIVVNAVLTIRNGFKTDIVAAHVNSAATKAQEEIRSLKAQLDTMAVDAAEKKQIAALLASKVVQVTNKPEAKE